MSKKESSMTYQDVYDQLEEEFPYTFTNPIFKLEKIVFIIVLLAVIMVISFVVYDQVTLSQNCKAIGGFYSEMSCFKNIDGHYKEVRPIYNDNKLIAVER